MARDLLVKFVGGPRDGQFELLTVPKPRFVYTVNKTLAEIDSGAEPEMLCYVQDDSYVCSDGFAVFKWVAQ